MSRYFLMIFADKVLVEGQSLFFILLFRVKEVVVYLKEEEWKDDRNMAVENEKIIQKMMIELQQAKTNQHHHTKMNRHLANVQVLCELILEESSVDSSEHKITNDEIKAMIGKEKQVKSAINHPQVEQLKKSSIHDGNNGSDSLFDF